MTRFVVPALVLSLSLAACAPKADDPASVAAIKKTAADYAAAVRAGDAAAAAAFFADQGTYAMPNLPVATGKAAVSAAHAAWLGMWSADLNIEVGDVWVNGNRATAWGTWTETMTPKSGSGAPVADSGSWLATYERQADGSWRWARVVPNSDRPAPGATADGAEEQALIKIEEAWAAANVAKDAAALDAILAPEFVVTIGGQPMTRAQMIAELKQPDIKVESAAVKDVRAFVFGDRALVTGMFTMKSTTKGKDSSQSNWFADVFAKRDGKWLALSTTAVAQP